MVTLYKYRVISQVMDLGKVDFELGYAIVCLIPLGLMRVRQNGKGSWA